MRLVTGKCFRFGPSSRADSLSIAESQVVLFHDPTALENIAVLYVVNAARTPEVFTPSINVIQGSVLLK